MELVEREREKKTGNQKGEQILDFIYLLARTNLCMNVNVVSLLTC